MREKVCCEVRGEDRPAGFLEEGGDAGGGLEDAGEGDEDWGAEILVGLLFVGGNAGAGASVLV